jgi:Transposase
MVGRRRDQRAPAALCDVTATFRVFTSPRDAPGRPDPADTGVGIGSELVDALSSPVRNDLDEVLAGHGVSVRDITSMISSHLRFDHCGQNNRFPHASNRVQRADVNAASARANDAEMPLEVRRLGGTIERRRLQIVAWHRSDVSNGLTEAVNNLAKRVKRMAFGMRRFRNHRSRALLYAGRPNWDLLDHLTHHEIRSTVFGWGYWFVRENGRCRVRRAVCGSAHQPGTASIAPPRTASTSWAWSRRFWRA